MPKKIFLGIALLLTCLAAGAAAQMYPPSGGPVPRWTGVPGARGVEYAPNLGQDIFRLAEKYYYLNQGKWYQGSRYFGPWQPIPQPPAALYRVEAPYFKTPPGWAKGKKTGWGGAPMPPGQMKKLQQPQMPPGQMKKYGY